MAESMQGLKRSHRCAEVSNALEGQKVTVMGWVQKSRNKGGIIFVDLRDRSGILQIIFEESKCGSECFEKVLGENRVLETTAIRHLYFFIPTFIAHDRFPFEWVNLPH